MAQEILLKNGERVSRHAYMAELAAKKEAPVKEENFPEAPQEVSGKMPVAQLKAVAKDRGLEVEGLRKSDLLDLLLGQDEDEDETGL